MSNTPAGDRSITRSDLLKSWFLWTMFSHSNYNYERLQATGFAHSMVPIIKRLYGGDKEATRAALKRHLVFFNTEPEIGAVIHGITIAMEEEKANGAPITDTAINSTKSGLMGPLAGVGDTLTQGIVLPLLLALGISITGLSTTNTTGDLTGIKGNVLGPILFLVLIAIYSLSLTYFSFMQGYVQGRKLVTSVFKSGLIDRVIVGAGVLGNLVLGGLAAKFITIYLAFDVQIGAQKVRAQQDFLDKIMPGILPLAFVLFTWWILKRGLHPIKLLVIYLVICILGAVPFMGPAPKWVTDQCGSSILQPYGPCADPVAK